MTSRKEHYFLTKLDTFLEECISSPGLDSSMIADHMQISTRQLERKLQQYTGLSPKKYVREKRLLKAKQLLGDHPEFTISEVACYVGFQKPSYFTSLFINRFGTHPKNEKNS
ncbi:MAG: helix-turn-helix transcriptional regulator [Balneolales bacterium]|nr:helix-turn-helix transcriptional regulator [Balneolales bacterium]